jgi:threonine dehydratase
LYTISGVEDLPVTLESVRAVRPDVDRFADRVPLCLAPTLSRRLGVEVSLKLESFQPTGSFKIRGAAARLGAIPPDELDRGVITASTGNHGRAVAHVASLLGLPATICVSEHVPPGKIDMLRRSGCTLDIGGPSQDAAFERATAAAARPDGPILVHSILDPIVLAGQGTCGLEIVEQRPGTALVIVPVSGGGLISGVAVAVRSLLPRARVIGVSMDRGAVMHASLRAGRPVALPEVETLADSLQGGIGLANETTFPIVQRLVDEIVLVTEDEIAAGMRHVLSEHRVVLEGAGAVGIAALLSGRIEAPDGPVVVVCSGAAAELATIAELASQAAAAEESSGAGSP